MRYFRTSKQHTIYSAGAKLIHVELNLLVMIRGIPNVTKSKTLERSGFKVFAIAFNIMLLFYHQKTAIGRAVFFAKS